MLLSATSLPKVPIFSPLDAMLLLYLFFYLSPCFPAQNLTDMLAQNPLLAKMAMFSEISENATVALPPEPPEDDDDLIQKLVSVIEFLES